MNIPPLRHNTYFGAVIMKHLGRYPMLERPDEFNPHVAAVVEELSKPG